MPALSADKSIPTTAWHADRNRRHTDSALPTFDNNGTTVGESELVSESPAFRANPRITTWNVSSNERAILADRQHGSATIGHTTGSEAALTEHSRDGSLYCGLPYEKSMCKLDQAISDEAWEVHRELTETIAMRYPDRSIETMALDCLDCYLAYLFPVIPLLDGSIMRASAVVLERLDALDDLEENRQVTVAANIQRPCIRPVDLACFSLLTAMCAEVYYMLPEQCTPPDHEAALDFLRASRRMLALQRDIDLEAPSSMSVITRYFHANCLHAAGQTRLSWILLGEAIRLVQDMRMYDEASLDGLNSFEASARRRVFWQLYTGDKSAALLNNRPFTLDIFALGIDPSTAPPSFDQHQPLLQLKGTNLGSDLETRLITGFNLCQKLFGLAAELLLELQIARRYYFHSTIIQWTDVPHQQKLRMTDLYLQFNLTLDNAPAVLKTVGALPDPTNKDPSVNVEPRMYQIQAVNLLVTYHCLHLILVERFAQAGAQSVLGLSQEGYLLDLKRSEIARGLVVTIQQATFDALRINGEPCVCETSHTFRSNTKANFDRLRKSVRLVRLCWKYLNNRRTRHSQHEPDMTLMCSWIS